ncbi:MAG: efflux RND transporter periplasmic adaptor subunit [Gammaproteobacteria bacterium]|jgi:HlyD family secretion protein
MQTSQQQAAPAGLDLGSPRRPAGRLIRWLLAGLFALAAAALLFQWLGPAGGGGVRYRTVEAQHGDLTVTVTATGSVQPTNVVDISSELSGIIRTVQVDYNDRVEVGQVLAELDTDKLEAEVAHSRATLLARKADVEEAEARVAEKQSEYERIRRLQAKNFSSQADLDTARAAYQTALAALASARAEVEVAEANLDVDETNLRKACICSPIDGIVLSRQVEPGQTVASSLQAPVLFTLAEDLTQMELEVDIDEADIGKVRDGQQASFTVEAFPARELPATITELRYAPETVDGVVTYKAVLAIDNSDMLLRPGMTATAEITVAHIEDALLVPNAALRFAPPGQESAPEPGGILRKIFPHRPQRPRSRAPAAGEHGERLLWLLSDGEPHAVTVTPGESDGEMTRILAGGVEAGDAVIVDAVAPRN